MEVTRTATQIELQHGFDDWLDDNLDCLKNRVDPDVIDALKDGLHKRAKILVLESLTDWIYAESGQVAVSK